MPCLWTGLGTFYLAMPDLQQEGVRIRSTTDNGWRKKMRTKKYIIEIIEEEDGKVRINRTCDGFTAYELLGLLWSTHRDIRRQIRGKKQAYTIINRRMVKEGMEEQLVSDQAKGNNILGRPL